eukprot:476621_1
MESTVTLKGSNKNRKKRTINNPLVTIEDITIESGLDYINWISSAKTKLKEREIKLMKIRFHTCQNTIITSIRQFTSENSQVFSRQINPPFYIQVNRMQKENYEAYRSIIHKTKNIIINTFNESITQQLAIWKGYKPRTENIKNKINTFRDYWKRSRGWWDVRKVEIITKNILIPISYMIDQFAQKAASEFFANRFFRLQKLYQTYLYTLIIIAVVEKTMELPNTKEMFIIPAQCYAMIELKNVEKYRCDKKLLTIAPTKTRTNKNAYNIRNDILKSLTEQYNISKLAFQTELLRLHCEVDNYKAEPPTIKKNNTCTSCSECIFDNKITYTNYHNSDYKSKAIRYHPYNM